MASYKVAIHRTVGIDTRDYASNIEAVVAFQNAVGAALGGDADIRHVKLYNVLGQLANSWDNPAPAPTPPDGGVQPPAPPPAPPDGTPVAEGSADAVWLAIALVGITVLMAMMLDRHVMPAVKGAF